MAEESGSSLQPTLAPASGETQASTIYRTLRKDILTGALHPGEKLRIDVLVQRYSVGASPLREALNRLSAESFVVRHEQRGFQVMPVSLDDLAELTRTRRLIIDVLLREAFARGDTAWEEGIVLAHYRLIKIESGLVQGEVNPEWEEKHRAFHTALIAACDSRWLIDFWETLFDCADRYRHLASKVSPLRDAASEHKEIVDAVLRRDLEASVRLLSKHVGATLDLLKKISKGNPAFID